MSLDNVEDAFALSPIQSGMLYDCLATPEEDVYVAYVSVDITGDVDSERLKQAWSRVFIKHQSLRAAFHWEGLDEPLQVIYKNIALVWSTLDWSDKSESQQTELMQALIASERSKKIELSIAPLSRFNLVQLGKGMYRLVWSVHHLLADGLSTPTILEDVLESYTSNTDLANDQTSSVYQYSAHIRWLAEQDQDEATEFWSSRLKDASPTPIRLPIRSRVEQAVSNEKSIPQINFGLSKEQTAEVASFCQNHKLTLSSFLHGAWALLIREYSGSESSLFTSTVSGRQSDVQGMDRAVGLYLNAQPRLIKTTSTESLVEWLRAIQSEIHQCAQYDYSSLRDIQKTINTDEDKTPFESIITIGGHDSELNVSQDSHEFKITNIHYQSTQSHYAMAFLAFPGEKLDLSLVYNPLKYMAEDVEGIASYLEKLVRAMLASANQSPMAVTAQCVSELSFARPKASVNYDGGAVTTVHGWFESIVDNTPNNTAISFAGEKVSYAELDARANKVANYILESKAGLSESAPIGLMLSRGIDQLAGLLGILKSGYPYVPIDPDFPKPIIQSYIDTAGISHIVGSESNLEIATQLSVEILSIEQATIHSENKPVGVDVGAESLAYTMFTSGSTGTPKGVQITHANLVYSTQARIDYYEQAKPKFLLLSSIAFDSSVAGIYWILCGGGELVLPKPEQEKDIQAIAQLISDEAVTNTLCLPSYYQLLLQNATPEQLHTLQEVIVAGEACTPELVNLHFKIRPECKLFNEYGPTEACVWSSVHQFKNEPTYDIPIGKPIGSTYLQVVNSHGAPCPLGSVGEIVIGGLGLSPGYLNNDAANVEKFIANPVGASTSPIIYKTGDLGYVNCDGNVVFTGRADRQLKIRGHRIEPGAVESVISAMDGVQQSVVVAVAQNRLQNHSVSLEEKETMLRKLNTEYSSEAILEALSSLELLGLDSVQTNNNGVH